MCILFLYSDALSGLIRQFFNQLTEGCGSKSCNNPNCATGRGRAFSPDEAATRAVMLVQTNGRLCESHLTSKKRTSSKSSSRSLVSSSSSELSVVSQEVVVEGGRSASSELSFVSQEVGVEGGRSEVTILHHTPPPQPSSEPMELALSPSDRHEHSAQQLVIGSSSSSMVRPFAQSHSSPSASLGSQTTSTTTASSSTSSTTSASSSSSSGALLPSSSSSSSSSALVHMASSNMVEDVARMEVSPSPHSSSTSSHKARNAEHSIQYGECIHVPSASNVHVHIHVHA